MSELSTAPAASEVRRVSADDFQFYVRQIYRLFRVSTMHMLNNQAVTRLVEQTAVFFGQLKDAELDKLNILFVDKTVFVNGQLLKANPEIYNLSIQLATFIQRLGYNELSIAHDVTEDDLRALMNVFVGSWKPSRPEEADHVKFKRVSLRRVKSEILDLLRQQATTPRERLVRTYASALIVLRHGWQRLLEGKPPALKSIKRVVQQLVKECNENGDEFRLLSRMRNMHDDPPGIAVKHAMLSICLMRQLTDDARVLVRVALASLYFDLGRPRALGVRSEESALAGGALPQPSPQQREAFAGETVLTGLLAAQMHPDSLERLIVAFETQLLALDPTRVPLPPGASLVDIEPYAVLIARRYAESMAFDVRTQRHMEPAEAITWLTWNCRNQLEILLTAALASALRISVDPALFSSSPAQNVAAPAEAVRTQRNARTTAAVVAAANQPVPPIAETQPATARTPDSAPDARRNAGRLRYDPMTENAPRRNTTSAPLVSTGEPQLTSALQASRETDSLLDPFFRARTGSHRTLLATDNSDAHTASHARDPVPAASEVLPNVHPAIDALRVARAITGEHPTVVVSPGPSVGAPTLSSPDFASPAEVTDARRQRLAGLANQESASPTPAPAHQTSQRHPFLGSPDEPASAGTQNLTANATQQRLASLVYDTTSSRTSPPPADPDATVANRASDLQALLSRVQDASDQATVFRPTHPDSDWLRPPTGIQPETTGGDESPEHSSSPPTPAPQIAAVQHESDALLSTMPSESERTVFVRPADRLIPERPPLTGGVKPEQPADDEDARQRQARIEELLAKYRPK